MKEKKSEKKKWKLDVKKKRNETKPEEKKANCIKKKINLICNRNERKKWKAEVKNERNESRRKECELYKENK